MGIKDPTELGREREEVLLRESGWGLATWDSQVPGSSKPELHFHLTVFGRQTAGSWYRRAGSASRSWGLKRAARRVEGGGPYYQVLRAWLDSYSHVAVSDISVSLHMEPLLAYPIERTSSCLRMGSVQWPVCRGLLYQCNVHVIDFPHGTPKSPFWQP